MKPARAILAGAGLVAVVLAGCKGRSNPAEAPGDSPEKVTVSRFDWVNPVGMKFIRIEAGEFMMGSPVVEGRGTIRGEDEILHRVRISRPFLLGATEVTQGQWEKVMGTRPWAGRRFVREGENYPAVYVTWQDCTDFCTRLGRDGKATYRLPTEAEWEYACRAGTQGAFSFDLKRVKESKRLKHYAAFGGFGLGPEEKHAPPVPAASEPNPWGLYDMHGSLWEWCRDWYGPYRVGEGKKPVTDPGGPATGEMRLARGGSWFNEIIHCRCAGRLPLPPEAAKDSLGFRVVAVEWPGREDGGD